jgi:hypothetical protein
MKIGTFSEEALSSFAQQVKEKKVKGGQGTEYADNLGVGKNDSSFIDTGGSLDKRDYYSEDYDFTVCVRDNGSVYGTAGKCRKGKETEQASEGTVKEKVKKKIAESPRIAYLTKAIEGRKNAIQSRESFIKENKYPAANPGMKKEVERIRGELEGMQKDLVQEKRRIAKQEVEGPKKATKSNLPTERVETPTQRAGREGVFNKSQWD